MLVLKKTLLKFAIIVRFLSRLGAGNTHSTVDIHGHNFIVHSLDDLFATLLIRDVSNKPPPDLRLLSP